jgi:hypothetical protein
MKASTVRILATLMVAATTSCLSGEDSRIEKKENEKGLASFFVQNESETIKQVKIWAFLG